MLEKTQKSFIFLFIWIFKTDWGLWMYVCVCINCLNYDAFFEQASDHTAEHLGGRVGGRKKNQIKTHSYFCSKE